MDKKTKDLIHQLAAVAILFAAVYYSFQPEIARYVMAVGVLGFASMTFISPYKGTNFRGKRLFRIQIFAVLLMVVSATLMFMYVKEWVIPLFISGLLTLYCSILFSRVYAQDEKDKNSKHS